MSRAINRERFVVCMEKVCHYIDHHLDEELRLEDLCDVAHFSKYHFHRQFSAYMGISLYQYIQQIRLKRAAYQLVFSQGKSVLDISLEAGFEHPESFTRAFKKRYQQSPSEFRAQPDWHNWHQRHHRIESRREVSMNVEIVEIEEMPVAVLEHRKSPTLIMDTVGQFIEWRKRSGLSPVLECKTLGIVYNDPNSVPPDEFKFDVAGEVKSVVPEDNAFGIVNKTIAGGRYAVACHKGSRDEIGETVYYLYQQWLATSGEELRDAPVFFHYLNMFPEQAEHELETNVYLPIQ